MKAKTSFTITLVTYKERLSAGESCSQIQDVSCSYSRKQVRGSVCMLTVLCKRQDISCLHWQMLMLSEQQQWRGQKGHALLWGYDKIRRERYRRRLTFMCWISRGYRIINSLEPLFEWMVSAMPADYHLDLPCGARYRIGGRPSHQQQHQQTKR